MESIIARSELSWGKRILYGIGGFFGANIATGVWARLCEVTFYALEAYLLGVIVIIAGAIAILVWMWNHVKHESTRTGIIVSIVWQVLVMIVMLQGL